VIEIIHVVHLPHALPLPFSRQRRVGRGRLPVLAVHQNLFRFLRPARAQGFDVRKLLPVQVHAALEHAPVLDVGLPVRPLEGLVGGGAAVDEVERVGEEAPDHGRDHGGEEGDGGEADARVLHAPAPHEEPVVEAHAAGFPDAPEGVLRLDGGRQDEEAHQGAVRGEEGGREEQEDEVVVVSVADALVQEDAVVVHLGDAAFADGAVLRAGGLEEAAGPAFRARAEEGVVVRVELHVVGVVLGRDVPWVAEGRVVEEEVGEEDGEEGAELIDWVEVRPGSGEVEIF